MIAVRGFPVRALRGAAVCAVPDVQGNNCRGAGLLSRVCLKRLEADQAVAVGPAKKSIEQIVWSGKRSAPDQSHAGV